MIEGPFSPVERPLRILQIIETGGPGGAETVFAQLSTGLRERGHRVHCIVGDGSWLPAEMQRRGFTVEVLDRETRSPRPFLQRVYSLLRSGEFDLVHAHLFDGSMYSAFSARLAGRPIVATLHGQVDIEARGIKSRLKRLVFRALITRSVAVSRSLKSTLQPLLGLPDAKMSVIHNGLERAVQDTTPIVAARSDARGGHFRLVAVGNIRQAKDYPTLLRALRVLIDRGIPIQLDIAGQPDGGGLYAQLCAQRHDLQLESNLTFHGFLSSPAALVANADIFVLSSSQEGFSLATIEAMLAGIAVVATRSGGPEEILQDGVTGLLVPTKDPIALADAIERLVRNPETRHQLANAARHDAEKRFGIQQMIMAYERLYFQTLDRNA